MKHIEISSYITRPGWYRDDLGHGDYALVYDLDEDYRIVVTKNDPGVGLPGVGEEAYVVLWCGDEMVESLTHEVRPADFPDFPK